MDHTRQIRRFCAALLLAALVFRLCIAGIPEKLFRRLTQSDMVRLPIYSETGQFVRFSSSEETLPAFFRESAPPMLLESRPVFTQEDIAGVEFSYLTTRRPDAGALLTAPLDWDLTEGDPAVLILHTHSTESYAQTGEDYTESSAYRTLEEEYNMLSVGLYVAERLQAAGIGVIQDRTVHDYPSYSGSYSHARKSVRAILEENPSIRLVLDLHRDAAGTTDSQLRTVAWTEGQTCAQLMLVMGTDASGLNHENWEKNLALALKLHVQLQRQVPGIMRPVCLRSQRFNQDLSPGMLLVEVGAAGNTREEALLAAEELAKAIIALAKGTRQVTADNSLLTAPVE